MTRTNILLAATFLLATTACSSPMRRGIRTFDAGDHPRALAHFLEAAPDVEDADPEQRARYALYRGLTHLSLGDMESAEHWLAEAKMWTDRDRTLLDPADRGRLRTAWVSIGHQPGTWGASVLATR